MDDFGGAVAAIERGYMQSESQNAAFIYQREIETKQRIIVGVNQFTGGGEPAGEILRHKPELEAKQNARVARVRAVRKREPAKSAVDQVKGAARDGPHRPPPNAEAH